MYPPLPRSEIQAPDGRTLAYAEYGRPNGTPVFFFHPAPGSRLTGQFFHNAAADRDVRVIAVDRPGYGGSSFQRNRTILDWPSDIAHIALVLGLERYAVAGLNAGGVYALACGAKLTSNVTAVALVDSLAPVGRSTLRGMSFSNKMIMRMAGRVPFALRLPAGTMAGISQRYPDRLAGQVSRSMAKVDRETLSRHEVREPFMADLAEGLRPGGKGFAQDMALIARPWGFGLGEVTAPVHLWQGEADKIVPPAMGRALARSLPHCTAKFIPGAGNLWVVDHAGEVLTALTEGSATKNQ